MFESYGDLAKATLIKSEGRQSSYNLRSSPPPVPNIDLEPKSDPEPGPGSAPDVVPDPTPKPDPDVSPDVIPPEPEPVPL